MGVCRVAHILTDSAPVAGEVPRGSRPQLSPHLTALAIVQYKSQVCTSSGLDTTAHRCSTHFCTHTWNAKAISRESRDAVGPPLGLSMLQLSYTWDHY